MLLLNEILYDKVFSKISLFQGPKQYPYNDLYLEKGGDPDKQPEEIKHYEI